MTASYRIGIDVQGRQSYTEDAGSRIHELSVTRGRTGRIGIGQVGRMDAVVKSSDGRYYLDRAEKVAGFNYGNRCLVQLVAAGERVNLFHGRIDSIDPILAPGGKAYRAGLGAADDTAVLADQDSELNLFLNKTIGRLAAEICAAAGWSGPTEFAQAGNFTSAVPWSWFEDQTALAALTELVEAEGGIFFENRNGAAVYHDRGWRARNRGPGTHVDLTDMIVGHAEIKEEIVTDVAVTSNPLREWATQVIYTHPETVRLKPSQVLVTYVEFNDLAVRVADPLVAGSYNSKGEIIGDYFAQDPTLKETSGAAKGKPKDRTSLLGVSLTRIYATRCRVGIRNKSATQTIDVSHLQLRGMPVRPTSTHQSRVTASDDLGGATAITDIGAALEGATIVSSNGLFLYNRHGVDNRLVQGSTWATWLAKFLYAVLSRSQLRVRVACLAKTEADMLKLAKLEIDDRVRISIASLGLVDADFWIDQVSLSATAQEPNFLRATFDLFPVRDFPPESLLGRAPADTVLTHGF